MKPNSSLAKVQTFLHIQNLPNKKLVRQVHYGGAWCMDVGIKNNTRVTRVGAACEEVVVRGCHPEEQSDVGISLDCHESCRLSQ